MRHGHRKLCHLLAGRTWDVREKTRAGLKANCEPIGHCTYVTAGVVTLSSALERFGWI